MIKLLAIDMDGTLLSDKKHIAEAQKKAIRDAIKAGVHVVLCTGRPLIGVLPFYEELYLLLYSLHLWKLNGGVVFPKA